MSNIEGARFINLNGSQVVADQISQLLEMEEDPTLRKVLHFLMEWWDDKDFIIVKSSGTTGQPKNIPLKKKSLIFSARNTIDFLDIKKNDIAFLCLPVDYIAGKMMIIRSLIQNLHLTVILPSLTPEIDREYDISAMTPTQVLNLISKADNPLKKIKKLLIGGAPVNQYIEDYFKISETECFETYGMTETCSHIALRKLSDQDRSDFFSLLDGISINTSPDGCLIIDSDKLNVNNLITNDIVEIIDDKNFRWLGRKDNIINSGGLKLIPEKIESKLKNIIQNEFFIFGMKDDKLGSICSIAIEGEPTEISVILKDNLDKYEIPKKIFFLPKFIRTQSGKVNRIETIENLRLEL